MVAWLALCPLTGVCVASKRLLLLGTNCSYLGRLTTNPRGFQAFWHTRQRFAASLAAASAACYLLGIGDRCLVRTKRAAVAGRCGRRFGVQPFGRCCLLDHSGSKRLFNTEMLWRDSQTTALDGLYSPQDIWVGVKRGLLSYHQGHTWSFMA